jgi:hypothetical protein
VQRAASSFQFLDSSLQGIVRGREKQNDSDIAMRMFRDAKAYQSYSYEEIHHHTSEYKLYWVHREPKHVDQPLYPELESDKLRQAILPLYRRVYWTRLWIVQEVLLAANPVLLCYDKACQLGSQYIVQHYVRVSFLLHSS